MDDYPPGYGKLAAIEACDPNFLIYRKFAWLHNRLLLQKQDELYELEQSLERLDQSDFAQDPRRLKSRRRDEHVSPSSGRKELLKQIDEKLENYRECAPYELRDTRISLLVDETLLRLQQVQAIKRPTKRNQSSLWHLITTTSSQLSSDSDWIFLGPDLAAVAHDQEYGWFQNFFEDLMNKISTRATTVSFFTKFSWPNPTSMRSQPKRTSLILLYMHVKFIKQKQANAGIFRQFSAITSRRSSPPTYPDSSFSHRTASTLCFASSLLSWPQPCCCSQSSFCTVPNH